MASGEVTRPVGSGGNAGVEHGGREERCMEKDLTDRSDSHRGSTDGGRSWGKGLEVGGSKPTPSSLDQES